MNKLYKVIFLLNVRTSMGPTKDRGVIDTNGNLSIYVTLLAFSLRTTHNFTCNL